MQLFQFKKIDAFATASSSGNPAGFVLLDSFEAITESQMQRMAAELKGFVSEVAFVAPVSAGAFRARYFSAEKEVQFCGHATVAMMYDMIAGDAALQALASIELHTNKGILTVENRIHDEDAVYIYAPVPVYAKVKIELQDICQALGISASQIDDSVEPGLVNAGNQTLCVALNSLDDIVSMRPAFDTLLDFCRRHQLDVVTVHTRDAADKSNRLRTRVFAAPFGYMEDPATGSGNAALGYHLYRNGHWDGTPMRIEQNGDIANPNIVRLASVPDGSDGIRVIFGGAAITRIEGSYRL